MDYCGPRGIPLLHFLGGRLEWDPYSQAAALWWQAHESRRCPQCGSHPDDWADDSYAYHAESYTCRGCEFSQAKRDTLAEVPGAHIRLAPGAVNQCRTCKR